MRDWLAPLPPDDLARLVVVSPHFDDAVLGCGLLLARCAPATVVTVMGGARPGGYATVTTWDAAGGFTAGEDVVAARREEDAAALAELGCRSSWLAFSDHQYDEPSPGLARPPVEEVAAALLQRLDELDPTAVVVPFGLANPDHALTGEAATAVLRERPGWTWLGYADAGYEQIPGVLAWRIGRLVATGVWPTPAHLVLDGPVERKRAAVRCYTSQLPALREDWGFDPDTSLRTAETYWRLAPPPPGWGPMQS